MRQARAVLEASGFRVRLERTWGPGSAEHLAREAAAEAEAVIVCGGDGTLNEAVNGLAGCATPLIILPGGTANIAARELGLPLDPVLAARAAGGWISRRISLGLARFTSGSAAESRRYFLSVAGVGFDAYVISKLSVAFKTSWGVAAYVGEAFRQWARGRFPGLVCRVDGREVAGTFGAVQRTSLYGGWLRLAPGASLFRDRLTLCLFKSSSRIRYLTYAVAVLLRRHTRLPDVALIEAGEVGCAPAPEGERVYVETDGELAGALPATFSVAPNALTLRVPQRAAEG